MRGHGGGGGHGHGSRGVNPAAERLLSSPFTDRPKPTLPATYWRLLVVNLLDLCVTVALFVAMTVGVANDNDDDDNSGSGSEPWSDYTLRGSVFDVLCVCVVRVVHTATIGATGRPSLYRLLYRLTALYFVLMIAKLIVYNNWSDPAVAGYSAAIMVANILFLLVEVVLLRRLLLKVAAAPKSKTAGKKDGKSKDDDDEENDDDEMTVVQLLSVLRPYFWPRGTLNKVQALSTYLLLGLSKACGVVSPIFIGAASESLIRGEVDYTNIALYAATALGTSAFKELQSVVYLGVKQTAFVEISERTFGHLHALSYDWHVQKKLGDVLRSMDRGISSADTVVTYLFLMLIPNLVQCFVVFGIFYAHFNQPRLCAVAFLALVLYSWLTVTLTLW